MNRSLRVLLPVVLAMGTAPATADEIEWAGVSCGFTSTNDPTGAVQQNPDVQFGEMEGGPVVAADVVDNGGGAHFALGEIDIHCWLQVNNRTPAHAPISSAHCDFSGTGVAGGACQISYTATATDNVYLCSGWYIRHNGYHEDWYFDEDDDPSNGIQCALAISTGG